MTHPITVLYTDDDPLALHSIKRGLNKFGCNVVPSLCGRHALELARIQYFDAVILDLKMPEMNGLQFLHKLRELDPWLPVLILTGLTSNDTLVQALQQGCDEYIEMSSKSQDKAIIERLAYIYVFSMIFILIIQVAICIINLTW